MNKGWESPLTITEEICRNVVEAYDGYILEEVRKVVPYIDKDELVKALEYDRGQYEKGYADGRADATKHGHNTGEGVRWFKCSICGWGFNDIFMTDESHIETFPNYCPNCGARMDEVEDGEVD